MNDAPQDKKENASPLSIVTSPLSAVAGEVAKAADTGPGKALLGPAAKVLGDYLGWRAEEIVAGWKRRKEENVKAHHERVVEKEGKAIPREPTEKQVKLINDWMEGAQEVDPEDPEDPEIAALWQGLLGSIYRKETATKEMLEVVKQLDERDAKTIAGLGKRYSPSSRYERQRAERLVRLGVLEPFDITIFVRRFLPLFGFLAIALLFVILLISYGREFTSSLALPSEQQLIVQLVPNMLITVLIFTGAVALLRAGIEAHHYDVSSLGRKLQLSMHRYLHSTLDQEKQAEDRGTAAPATKQSKRAARKKREGT